MTCKYKKTITFLYKNDKGFERFITYTNFWKIITWFYLFFLHLHWKENNYVIMVIAEVFQHLKLFRLHTSNTEPQNCNWDSNKKYIQNTQIKKTCYYYILNNF